MNEQDKILRDALMPLAEEEIAKFDAADARQHRFSLRYRLGMNRIYQNCERSAPNHHYHRVNRKTLVAILIAAALMAILAIPAGSSVEYKLKPGELIDLWGKRLYTLPEDTPIEYGDRTLVIITDVRHYQTLNECFREEGVRFLYPTWLPDEAVLEEVNCSFSSLELADLEGETIHLKFSSDLYYKVHLKDEWSDIMPSIEEKETIVILGQETEALFSYDDTSDLRYSCCFAYNGYSYCISALDVETIYKIIDGLQE